MTVPSRSPHLLLMLCFGALMGLAVVLLWPAPQAQVRAPDAPATHAVVRPEQAAAQVLRLWDGERAEAWATGDAPGLRALYVEGSSAGEADVALLAQWRARGLRVFGISMQVVRLDVLARDAGLWRLRVTDRLAAAEVVGPGVEGTLVSPKMPPGATRTRVLELREQGGTWRMALVRAL